MDSIASLQRAVGEWHSGAKGAHTDGDSLLSKLIEETLEVVGLEKPTIEDFIAAAMPLRRALDDDDIGEELADVIITALVLADLRGIDATAYIVAKMDTNRLRTWSLGDDGRLHHR